MVFTTRVPCLWPGFENHSRAKQRKAAFKTTLLLGTAIARFLFQFAGKMNNNARLYASLWPYGYNAMPALAAQRAALR